MKVENAESLNKDLTTTYTLAAQRFGKSMGSLLMVRPRVLGTEYLEADHKPRVVPIHLRQTMQAGGEYDIALPAGFTVDEMPPPIRAARRKAT